MDVGVITADSEGWCSVAGHRQQGMLFHVKATGSNLQANGHHGGGASGGGAGSNGSGSNVMTAQNGNVDLHASPGRAMSGVTRCCSPYLRVRSVTGRPCTK